MYTEEKKKDKNYGSIFAYCVLCFVLIVEVARFAKPYYGNLQNLMETEALVVEEGFVDVMNSGKLPCPFKTSRSASARSHEKLSGLIRREDRARPPSSYCVKFQNFATMAKLVKDNGDKYESRPFSVGGYNWTLLIYPNENKPVGSGGYVSMYVRIDNSSLIANPHDVYAEITFLTYKSTIDRYHFLQETDAQRFHLFKQQYGQLNFLEIGYYKDPGHGFIFDGGQSVFGVDILVANPFEKWEVFSYEENIRDPLFNWKLTKFSTCNLDYYTSGSFSSGGRDWVLKVYPNGVGHATGNSLSLFLLSASNEKGYVKAKLRVIDQIRSNNLEKQVDGWPNATENGWGFEKFISFADLKDSTKGFLADDAIKFEVEILSFSKTDTL
ncbi:hypothetical protein HID58_027724 [Brassica napus]|uniref:MATH domain-containing protein n=2 Tax=Brassica napus TaxID=3708 RepID=A0ABQ8CSL5_BRANA|nr:probable inactive serine/threonine-protein kinase fnkC [Brassica napus]KAH0920064.1 hypothetical protein HID58_027724 [Brassica napus]